MAQYKKKPIVVEAWQWKGENIDDAQKFCQENNLPNFNIGGFEGKCGLVIPTLEGRMIASKNDFIIRGVKGEYYPCKPDVFRASYDTTE